MQRVGPIRQVPPSCNIPQSEFIFPQYDYKGEMIETKGAQLMVVMKPPDFAKRIE